jgi:hypothetical protein
VASRRNEADDARASRSDNAEAVAHLKGNWADDVAAYDKIHSQILQMADMLSAGIINQYPAKFK